MSLTPGIPLSLADKRSLTGSDLSPRFTAMPSSHSNHDSADDPQDPRIDDGVSADEGSILIPECFLPGVPVLSAGTADVGLAGEGSSVSDQERLAIARGRLVAQWLQELGRHRAPFSLDGLVVAAMNPGHRQTRAIAALSGLTGLKAPSQLDILVARNVFEIDPSSLERAPLELDNLVEERVNEPEAGLVKGMAKRLYPIQAPLELEGRVELQLESSLHPEPAPSRRWLRTATVGIVLAASVLMISRMGQWVPAASPSAETPTEVAFGDVRTTARGLSFTVTSVDRESMSDSDRDVLKAIGLPTMGGS